MNRQSIPHDYYYGCEAEQYTFYRFPKALFTNDRYKGLTDSAKILYGLMLDRMGLSLKNGWLDKQNRVFIYFTLEDLQEYMNCGHNKGVKLMAELDNIGLIERVKQGLGRPAFIYVKRFSTDTAKQPHDRPALVKKIGKTTYRVRVHFSTTNTETMNDKIKRMLKTRYSRCNLHDRGKAGNLKTSSRL